MRYGALGAALSTFGLAALACTDLGNLTGGVDDAGAPDAPFDARGAGELHFPGK